MDDFDFFVALLTPASDLVEGDSESPLQGIFARAGNDVIYGFDPGINNSGNPKVDVLVGDLFDNSPEEFQIILDIQNGNPLAILDRGKPPSVGADRFVLGDEVQPYYTTFDPASLITTNLLGTNQFAVLYDFDLGQDTIQLNGKKDDYLLLEVNGLQVQGNEYFGEAIFSLQQGAPDLVAYVISTPEVDLDLGANYFKFVGNKPEDKPEEKKIGQLGTSGIDKAFGAATDTNGNVYIAGSTSGPLGGVNKGATDAWVAKYNNTGSQIFLKQSDISTAGSESASAVATDDEGNFYLAGTREQNATVAKFNSSGQQQWAKQVALPGAFSTSGFGLDIDGEGNVYLSGLGIKENQNREVFDFPVEDDAWIAKFNSGGTQQWLTPIDTPFFNENYDLTVDLAGNSYAVGWTQGLVEESDPSRQLLKYDVWISKQDTNGNIQWIQQLGSKDQGLEFAWGVDTDSQGNIYVTGWTTGALGTKDKKFEKSESYDVFLAKFAPELDGDGNSLLWAKQIGSEGDDAMFLSDLHIDARDNIFLTGYTNDKLGKGDEDKEASSAWVGRFDTQGNNQWIQQFGSKEALDYGMDLSTDGNGKLYVTGSTEGFLGTSNGAANGAAVDAWLAQLDVEKGKLQKFIDDPENFFSILDPEPIATTDITNQLVVNEQLPNGDNRIDPDAGLANNSSVINYGQVVSNITTPFAPTAENSFGSALVEFLGDDLIPPSGTVENLKLEGTDGDDNLVGGAGNDEIKGKKGSDEIKGLAGDDKLEGEDGDDTLYGGTGADELKGGNQNDLFIIEEASEAEFDIFDGGGEELDRNSQGDTIVNRSDGDALLSKFQESWGIETFAGGGKGIVGNDSNNTLDFRKTTLSNVAFVDGGAGEDEIKGGAADETFKGGADKDKIEGNDGSDNISGDAGTDELKGGKGSDEIFGGADNDKLEGNDGNDKLIGGTGNDELKGGKGVDELIGVDTINGVSGLGVGEIDKLKGEDGGDRFILGNSGQVHYNDGDAATAGLGDYALIDDFKFDQTDTIQLQGVSGDYTLASSPDSLPKGTTIYFTNGQTEPEAIAVVKDIDPSELSLSDSSVFTFV